MHSLSSASTLRLGLLATLAITSCREKSRSEDGAAEAPRDTGPRLYVLGSSVHLRKEPSAKAESLAKLRIGTECVPLEPAQGEWRKVRCGDKEGHASASLLGAEKPSLEKLRAEAQDPKLTLAQRMDSALRAATLAPEDASLSKSLGDLFFERNFELLAGLKKPLKGPKIELPCTGEDDAADCIRHGAGFVRGMKRRAVTQGRMFVVVVGDSEQAAVYRGQFRSDPKSQALTVEVLERARFEPTPELEQALFANASKMVDDASVPRLGEFVLDESAQKLLGKLPSGWELLQRSDEEKLVVRINGCNQQSYLLRLSPDLHGRWLAVVETPGAPFPDERWVSAASRTEHGTKLTLSKNVEDTAPQVFEVPDSEDTPAALGEALYTHQTEKYSDQRETCGSGAPGTGPVFSGEFSPEKALVALFGRFDTAKGASLWVPSASEQHHVLELVNEYASDLWATPFKWGTYREGEQEKMLFLADIQIVSIHKLGGGIFSKTEDGWRLERANRVILEVPPVFEAPPGHDLSVQGLGERGFVAVLPFYGHSRVVSGWTELFLISDMGGKESIDGVGTIPDVGGEYLDACPWDSREESLRADAGDCYSYDSTWKFAPTPDQPLPDLIVTTKGTRIREGASKEVESFHEVRTFSFGTGKYTLTSRQNVPLAEAH